MLSAYRWFEAKYPLLVNRSLPAAFQWCISWVIKVKRVIFHSWRQKVIKSLQHWHLHNKDWCAHLPARDKHPHRHALPHHPQHVRFNVRLLSWESLAARGSHNSAGWPLTCVFDEVSAAEWGWMGGTAKRSWSICAEQHPAGKEDGRNPKIHSLWQHISTALGFLPLFSPPHGLPGTWILLMKQQVLNYKCNVAHLNNLY